jgi:hypothetical protein
LISGPLFYHVLLYLLIPLHLVVTTEFPGEPNNHTFQILDILVVLWPKAQEIFLDQEEIPVVGYTDIANHWLPQ